MKFIKYIFMPMLALFSGCETYSEEEVLVNRIIDQTARQLKKEKELRIIGDNAQMMDEIKILGMEFQYYQKATLEESRELLIYCMETFLKNINENQKIRPYLANYPFTVKNIKIGIWMDDWNKTFLQNIELISTSDGVLTYKLPSTTQFGPAPILKEETYEEALEALKEPAIPAGTSCDKVLSASCPLIGESNFNGEAFSSNTRVENGKNSAKVPSLADSNLYSRQPSLPLF